MFNDSTPPMASRFDGLVVAAVRQQTLAAKN
jgi:hypothetical protein